MSYAPRFFKTATFTEKRNKKEFNCSVLKNIDITLFIFLVDDLLLFLTRFE